MKSISFDGILSVLKNGRVVLPAAGLLIFISSCLFVPAADAVLMGGAVQGITLNLDSSNADVTTFAGSGSLGSTDDIGTLASFKNPSSITTDGTYLYVSDTLNHKIRKIEIATGIVTTLAGSGTPGAANGSGTSASFSYPRGITTDGTNLYVSDNGNHKIRKVVISTGEVTTLAGSGAQGSTDATGTAASFYQPWGITTDGTNLYVADQSNHKIRKIVISTGVVTTLAGSGAQGSTNAAGEAASFNYPFGITTDGPNLYVADRINNKIRKIVASTGVVTTFAGSGAMGSTDATGNSASFYYPADVTTDGTNLYVADTRSQKIRRIAISTGEVTTLAGSGTAGSTNDTGTAASFNNPMGITTDGKDLFIVDFDNHRIRGISPLDTTPPAGSISISNGVTSTATFSVTLNLSCDDGTGEGCAEMQFTNRDPLMGGYSTPEPYSATKAWILTCGSGTKTVFARFKDNNGLWSGWFSDTIDYNTNASMAVNFGAPYSSSQNVQLTTDPAGCSSYSCTGRSVKNENDGSFTSYTCGSPASWTLSAGAGDKTVYMTENFSCYETNGSACGYWCCGGYSPYGCQGWCPNSCNVAHSREMCDTILLDAAPTAQHGGPYTADLGAGISFNGSGSSDPDQGDAIVVYSWKIDGGVFTLTGATPSLDAAQIAALGTGAHSIQLTVTDSYGATGTASTSLTVYDNRPFAGFTTSPNPAACSQIVNLDASGSYHGRPDRNIVSYSWDFGDGGNGSGVAVQHAFAAFGNYDATLTVTDNNAPARTSTATVRITINQGNHAPAAHAGGPYTARTGEGIQLTGAGSSDADAACGDAIVAYAWDINNGAILLTGVTPSLTPEQIGTLGLGNHSLVLTVTDSFGATGFVSTTLEITQNNANLALNHTGTGAGTVGATPAGGSVTANYGALVNGPVWTAGRYGNGLRLANGQYVTVADSSGVFNITGDLTLAMWIKPDSVSCSGPDPAYALLSKRSANHATPYEFYIGCGGSLNFHSWATKIQWPTFAATGTITTGEWQHVAVTRSFDDTNATVTFYINGVQAGSSTLDTGPAKGSSDPVWISRDGYHTGYTSQGSYSGLMDEVQIYNRALPATEISRIYSNNHDLAANRAGNWKFDEFAGTYAADTTLLYCPGNCGDTYSPGTIVTLTATPAPGSVFAGWSGDDDCSDGTVTMDGGKSCTAAFTSVDSTPEQFAFTQQTDVPLNTLITGNTITVGGIDTAAPITITAGDYRVNDGPWTSTAGTVNNGDTVTVRLNSSPAYSTTATATLNIGGVSAMFSVTTVPDLIVDPVPPPINNVSQTITGTVKSGAAVTVSLNGGPAQTAAVIGTGWSCNVTNLVRGDNNITVAAADTGYSPVKSTVINCTAPRLTVTIHRTDGISGSAGGAVTSTPLGIACADGSCASLFDGGSTVTLMATPDNNSLFGGWGGALTGSGKISDLVMGADLGGDRGVMAAFTYVEPAKIQATGDCYPHIRDAYEALTGSGVILARQFLFGGGLNLNRGIALTIKGGYDPDYVGVGSFSSIQGPITVGNGSLTVERVEVR